MLDWSPEKIVTHYLKLHEEEGELEHGIEHEIKCQFIDFRPAKLEDKLKFLRERENSDEA